MKNSMFDYMVYALGTVGICLIGRLVYRFVTRHRDYLDNVLFTEEEEELPVEPKAEAISFKASVVRLFKYMLKRFLLSTLLIVTLLSCLDILLYINRELVLNIQWLPDFYGTHMADLNLSHDEIYRCFSYLHIVVGIVFMIEPFLEIAYFRYKVSRLRPKGRMMNGSECFVTTNEIGRRFYSTPSSLMSKPRKTLRKVLLGVGVFLTLSWIVAGIILK